MNDSFKSGFTLIEILVALAISALLVGSIYGLYVSTSRYYFKNIAQAELTQNGRIALERISRDLRQATRIITPLPPNESDPLNPPSSEILFQDGHDTSQISYIRYQLNGNSLKRQKIHYYFALTPNVWVQWNTQDQNGNLPQENIDEDVVKADKLSSLKFYGSKNIFIDLTVADNERQFGFKTLVFIRNIQ